MTAYLTKPVSQAELFEAISRVLGVPEPQTDLAALVTYQARASGMKKLRVLLAEDNAVNQKVASRLLERQGHLLTIASDGRQALAAVGQRTLTWC